jgi:hypothetical protein
MNILISPTRRRALKVRNRLMKERIDLKMESLNRSLRPEEYAKYAVKDNDLKMIINVLNQILYESKSSTRI